jgi:hypothetical protein
MARPRVVGGEYDPQIWKVAVNILNKQSRTTDKMTGLKLTYLLTYLLTYSMVQDII